METKLEQVSALFEQTAREVSESPEKWAAFLDTAARMYKYGVDDQLLIYTQRPDATACAAISVWNKLKRWVKRGSKGIALLDKTGGRIRLGYVFDVSDTQAGRGGKDVHLWQLRAEHTEAVGRTLSENFGVKPDGEELPAFLLRTAAKAARDTCRVYFPDLMRYAEGSRLAGMKPRAAAEVFLQTVTSSVQYMTLARCGQDTSLVGRKGLDGIRCFNTPKTLWAAGNATQQISVSLLRQVERAVKTCEQKKARDELAKNTALPYSEGNQKVNDTDYESGVKEHGTDVSAGRGLPGPQPSGGQTAGGRDWDVRQSKAAVSQGTAQRALHGAYHDDQTVAAPAGNRPGSAGDGRPADGADEKAARRDREAQSGRSDALGTGGKQHTGFGAGDRDARPDLRLTDHNPEKTEGIIRLPSFYAPAVFNEMIRTTPYLKAPRPEIAAFFREHIGVDERADYIRGVFNGEPTELLIGENDDRYGYQAYPHALRLWAGSFENRTAESFVPWRGVTRDFAVLIALGEFLDEPEGQISLLPAEKPSKAIPQDAIDEILRLGSGVENVKYRIARFFERNTDPKERADFLKKEYGTGGMISALGNVSEEHDGKGIRLTRGRLTEPDAEVLLSWAKVQQRIGELLSADRYLGKAEKEQYGMYVKKAEEKQEAQKAPSSASFIAPPESKPEAMTPAEPAQASLFPSADSQIQQIAAEDVSSPAFSMPQADINDVLRAGSPYAQGKFRIYEQFQHRQGDKADAIFLKNEYGTSGGSFTFSDGSCGSVAYTFRGVFISRHSAGALTEPDRVLTWAQAAEQIRALIDVGQYLTPEEEEAYTVWAKGRTAAVSESERLHAQTRPAPHREKSAGGQITFSDLPEGGSVDTSLVTTESQVDHALVLSAMQNTPETAQISRSSEPESRTDNRSTPDTENNRVTEPEEKLSDIIPTATDMEEYDALQSGHPGELLAFQVGGYCLLFGAQAEIAAPLIGMKIREMDIPGRGAAQVTGFRAGEWQLPVRQLWKSGHDVALLQQPAPGTHREVGKELKAADYIPLGQKLTIDGRHFIVDAVNWDTGSVSLRDDTFAGAAGFPIFRRESIEYVRGQIESQEQLETIEDELKRAVAERIKSEQEQPEQAPSAPERANFRITDDALGVGGKKAKYGYNIAAIKLLKELEVEGRFATPEEQAVLSRYVGWGGVPQAFDEHNPQWADEYAELKNLLTDTEYAAARASTLNAHYTSPIVIKAMYETLSRMGFRTGNILEPACGIGNFFGLVPESMKESKLYGVELDSITGRIARQLYPQADITIDGFERTDQPDSFFDLAVGNVPFGGFKLADRRYNKYNFQIHDYFFAKTLDKVRPGGLIAFITSKGTLDKQNPDVRKYIAQRATLLGAVRLPNTAFHANAGTEVTTDILFLQRRDRLSYDEPEWINLAQSADGIPVNRYFIDHPDMMLGTMAFDSSMYGNNKETTCNPIPGTDLAQQLCKALSLVELPDKDALEAVDVTEPDGEEHTEDGAPLSLPADPDVRNFSYTLADDHLYFRENSRMNLVADRPETEIQRIRGMIGLRESTRKLIGLQMDDAPDAVIEQEQAKLNGLYDAYTVRYGLLSSPANRHAFNADSSYSLLASLEVVDEDGNLVRKADMFSKRTIRHAQPVTSVDTASEALAVSIAEKARVDLSFMASLMGGPEKIPSIVDDLRGVIFPVPDETALRGHAEEKSAEGETRDLPMQALLWVTADEYLSGNVREKLRIARDTAKADPLFASNVPALEQVQPKDLSAAEISVRLGATWIDTKYIDQFMYETLQTPRYLQRDIETRYLDVTGAWNIKGKGLDSRDNSRVYGTYGTRRRSAYYILEDSLNLKDTRIYDIIQEDGSEKRVLNEKETAVAQQKQEALKRAFTQWIWKDPERREVLCKKYNILYNSTRPREYDGRHLKFDGMNPEITLRKHQRNAVAHQLYGKNTLLAHWVGAGKSATRS